MHTVVDAFGNCLHLVLTPDKVSDSPQLPGLLAALVEQADALVADKVYDTSAMPDMVAFVSTYPIPKNYSLLTKVDKRSQGILSVFSKRAMRIAAAL